MKKELFITVKQFLLYLLLTQGVMILGLVTVVMLSISMGIDKDQEALAKFTSEASIAKWAFAIGFMLTIALFLGLRYVNLSIGRIERGKLRMTAFMTVLISLGWLFTETALLLELASFFPGDAESAEAGSQAVGLLTVITTSILAPIAEEIGFRGVLMGGLLRMRCKPWLAIMLSAIVFGLFHGTDIHFLGATLFGIIIGWVYWRTGSLIPGIIAHIVNNSIAIAFVFIPSDYEPSQMLLAIILVISLTMLTIGLRWVKKAFPLR